MSLYNPCPQSWGLIPFFGQTGRRFLLAGSAPHKSGGCQVKSWPYDKQTLQSYRFVTFIINKQHTSIRCNHTHWVHLKCTQIKQRQYKPGWGCTIHTPPQIVTTTLSTDSPSPTNHHLLTNNNQPKDKNIVILQININGIRNKIEELKKRVHSTQPDIITIQEIKLT